MKPTETWTRTYKSTSTYTPSPPCVRRDFEQESKALKEAINNRDPKDNIIFHIKKLESYIPIQKNSFLKFDYSTVTAVINIFDTFQEKGANLMNQYEKRVEVHALDKRTPKDLVALLKKEGFEPKEEQVISKKP